MARRGYASPAEDVDESIYHPVAEPDDATCAAWHAQQMAAKLKAEASKPKKHLVA